MDNSKREQSLPEQIPLWTSPMTFHALEDAQTLNHQTKYPLDFYLKIIANGAQMILNRLISYLTNIVTELESVSHKKSIRMNMKLTT